MCFRDNPSDVAVEVDFLIQNNAEITDFGNSWNICTIDGVTVNNRIRSAMERHRIAFADA